MAAHGWPNPKGRGPEDNAANPVGSAAMSFLRSTLLPAAIVLLFALALFAVSARIWLPGDMAAPAPVG
jgi:hypothetical protein